METPSPCWREVRSQVNREALHALELLIARFTSSSGEVIGQALLSFELATRPSQQAVAVRLTDEEHLALRQAMSRLRISQKQAIEDALVFFERQTRTAR